MKNESLSRKESVILNLLSRTPEMYGLDLVDQSNGVLARGVVYIPLASLKEKGLVASRPEDIPITRGIRRNLYSLTEAGRAKAEGRS
jgi:DNA-binding PadR family transcriptional regulator